VLAPIWHLAVIPLSHLLLPALLGCGEHSLLLLLLKYFLCGTMHLSLLTSYKWASILSPITYHLVRRMVAPQP